MKTALFKTTLASFAIGMAGVGTTALGKTSPSASEADTVFTHGRIYTVNEQQPWAESIAIDDGRIIYVGDQEGTEQYVGDETKVINLRGRMLMPGFIDTHVHPVLAAAAMNLLAFDEEDKLEVIYKKLKDYAEEHPEQSIIVGNGYNHRIFKENPTRVMLDDIVAERPVFLLDSGGHMGWANSKALEMAGITAKTPDPVPGSHYYVRDEAGQPTGYMFEEETFTPFVALGRGNAKAEIKNNVGELFSLMSAFGITSVFDASMEWLLDDGLEVLKELEDKSELPFRVVGSLTVERGATTETLLTQLRDLQQHYHSDRLSIGAFKLSLDGTRQGKSAALINTYLHGGSGALNWEPEAYKKLFVELDKGGADIHIHAIGDRAVNLALDGIEAARQANGFQGTRHTICHTEMVQTSDIPRFKALDAIAQTTPVWHADNSDVEAGLHSAKEREKLYPFRSIANTDARVTFGSDFPYGGGLEALIPAYNLEVGHTRVWPGQDDVEPMPRADEKLDLETLVRGYTLDAAYQIRMEDKIGSIEVGKRADLITLNKNLFDISSEELHEVKVKMTMVDGEVVYQRPFYQWLIEWWLEI